MITVELPSLKFCTLLTLAKTDDFFWLKRIVLDIVIRWLNRGQLIINKIMISMIKPDSFFQRDKQKKNSLKCKAVKL